MGTTLHDCTHEETTIDSCTTIPPLERLCYFFGQMLEVGDFRAEQRYFTTLLSLLARCTAGWGVVCGLDVKIDVESMPGCDQKQDDQYILTVTSGIGIDCCGRFIVLRKDCRIPLDKVMNAVEREAFLRGDCLYVSIEHVEKPVRPTRGIADGCDPMAAVQYGRIRDEARVVVSVTRPEHPDCDTCLAPCTDRRLLLASICRPDRARPRTVQVRPEVRRMLARHELSTITAVGWVHAGEYPKRQANRLINEGFGLRFSRPVSVASLKDGGVISLIVYSGGAGYRDVVGCKALDFEPDAGFVSEVFVKVSRKSQEDLREGDQAHLVVRCDFLLDKCCRAVSGAHLGGRVSFDRSLARSKAAELPTPAQLPTKADGVDQDKGGAADQGKARCTHPPDRRGPWYSGNGVEGGVWESWITVVKDPDLDTPAEAAP